MSAQHWTEAFDGAAVEDPETGRTGIVWQSRFTGAISIEWDDADGVCDHSFDSFDLARMEVIR